MEYRTSVKDFHAILHDLRAENYLLLKGKRSRGAAVESIDFPLLADAVPMEKKLPSTTAAAVAVESFTVQGFQ